MNEKIRQLQLIQLEMLIEIDKVCKKYNIKYSLYAGTMLGAVRHKGFIPWDDDLDICMTREEYDKFLTVWNWDNHEGYILQNKENEPRFTQSFTKIRKEHTTFIQAEWEKERYHTGVFVDIFPIDRIPNGKANRLLFSWRCLKYQLYTREFVPPNANIIIRLFAKLILDLSNSETRKLRRRKLLEKITKNNNCRCNRISIETKESLKQICPIDLFEEYTLLEFEGMMFMSVKKWDEWLEILYGDYMELPPLENRRWAHHPIILDFNRSYEEL